MAIGAGITSTAMSAAHVGTFPATSMVSILALGPILDFALLGHSSGWRLYLRFAAAGAATNLLAFGSAALVSFLICGALAGLIGATVWFRFRVHDDLRRN
jgi:hypothetical protein